LHLGKEFALTDEADRVTYLRWKARESRVAARLCVEPRDRLVLLKMAQIYDRLARQAAEPWAEAGDGAGVRPERAPGSGAPARGSA
jgi:hypothetical protein